MRASLIIESDKNLEVPVQSLLKGAGILLLSDWDVLIFMYRHGPSLTNAAQIASLIGYEASVVNAALDRDDSQDDGLAEFLAPSGQIQLVLGR